MPVPHDVPVSGGALDGAEGLSLASAFGSGALFLAVKGDTGVHAAGPVPDGELLAIVQSLR